MRRVVRCTTAAAASLVVAILGTDAIAAADPAPGFGFDPVALEEHMDACMAYAIPGDEILMGWVRVRDGAPRQWRCSSLRHMLLDSEGRFDNQVHDPYVNVSDFLSCTDEVVSYGFPRPGDPGYTRLIKNFNGADTQAIVIVNDANGDIASIYTTNGNDWSGCASALW